MEELTNLLIKFKINVAVEKFVDAVQDCENHNSQYHGEHVVDIIKKLIPNNPNIEIQAFEILQLMIRNNLAAISDVEIYSN